MPQQIPLLASYGDHPEDAPYSQSYARNKPVAKAGPYTTKLSHEDEQKFQAWVEKNKIPWTDSTHADYDMRGYWKALQEGKVQQTYSPFDGTMHFPDTFKTPYDATFSNQSIYAKPNAPHWVGDNLFNNQGRMIVNETTPQSDPLSQLLNLFYRTNFQTQQPQINNLIPTTGVK